MRNHKSAPAGALVFRKNGLPSALWMKSGRVVNLNLFEYTESIKNKRIAVIGTGISNKPLIEFLASHGCDVTVCDRYAWYRITKEAGQLESLGVKWKLGPDFLEELDFDVIFRTPSLMPFDKHLMQAKQKGSIVTSEMELFFEVCPCRVIAVTGSDGKTTTTTVISQLLKAAGYTVHLGGNIGWPLLCDTIQMKADDVAVVELSSFQLHSMTCRPCVSVITNISPNHLDVHKDYEDYVEAKKSIYRKQQRNDVLVLNADDVRTPEFASEAHSQIRLFCAGRKVQNGVFCKDGVIWRAKNGQYTPVLRVDEIWLPGMHNCMNYMAAFAATQDDVPDDVCRQVAMTFKGVEHRLEMVRELRGITFINDSIATSPTRTIEGLHSLKTKPIVIAGGSDKKIPFDALGDELCQYAKAVFLTGDTAELIREAIVSSPYYTAGILPVHILDGFRETVLAASDAAEEGDIVLLSPACASFDHFKDYAQRGRAFKSIIRNLPS